MDRSLVRSITHNKAQPYFRLLGMIGMMGTIWHDIMPNGCCTWHDGVSSSCVVSSSRVVSSLPWIFEFTPCSSSHLKKPHAQEASTLIAFVFNLACSSFSLIRVYLECSSWPWIFEFPLNVRVYFECSSRSFVRSFASCQNSVQLAWWGAWGSLHHAKQLKVCYLKVHTSRTVWFVGIFCSMALAS